MGMPIAQAAQPISQQQPAPQGKGGANLGLDQNAINANPQGFSQWQQDAQKQEMQHPNSTVYAPAVMPDSQQQGKGMQSQPQQQQQYQGKGRTTNAATSGQPQMGRPNSYSNTIQPWDNANIQPQTQSGKGKGY